MKYLLIITLILFTSCTTQRRCNRKFPPQIITNTVTEYQTVYRDTTIFVRIPGENTHTSDTVYIENGLPNSRESFLQTKLSFSRAQVVNGILRHSLNQKDTAIERVINDAIRDSSTHTVEVKETVKEVNILKWWQTALMWAGVLAIILIIIKLVW